MMSEENGIWDQFNDNRKRQVASRKRVKERKITNKESEQEKQRSALSSGTHTTLGCDCCVSASKHQQTSILAVRQINICAQKADFCALDGYPFWINSIYSNDLDNIWSCTRPSLARS